MITVGLKEHTVMMLGHLCVLWDCSYSAAIERLMAEEKESSDS